MLDNKEYKLPKRLAAFSIALGISTIVRIILSRVYELPLSTFVFPWGLFPLFLLSIAGGIIVGLVIGDR